MPGGSIENSTTTKHLESMGLFDVETMKRKATTHEETLAQDATEAETWPKRHAWD